LRTQYSALKNLLAVFVGDDPFRANTEQPLKLSFGVPKVNSLSL